MKVKIVAEYRTEKNKPITAGVMHTFTDWVMDSGKGEEAAVEPIRYAVDQRGEDVRTLGLRVEWEEEV